MHLALLLLWTAIAAILRFTCLTTKPVWADEFSTLIFSLGNSYLSVPLDRVLTLPELLQPLQPNSEATLHSVVHNLLTESNHPPLYFALTHLWLKLFPADQGYVSVGAARALSAWFGVASVPAMYGLGWLTGRSRVAAHLAALLTALSPFGIYLAQEARHYTLAGLWIIASLSCLVVAAQRLESKQKIPLWLCSVWIVVNGLGVATHYFMMLALVAEAIALLLWWLLSRNHSLSWAIATNRWRLFMVNIGTLTSILVWLPALVSLPDTDLTKWLQAGEFDHALWLDQLLRSLAATVSMVYLLPFQSVPTWVVLGSGVTIGLLLLWTVPLLWCGWKNQAWHPATRSMLLLVGSYVGVAIALSLIITFGLGTTFSSVFRYRFICLPGFVLLVAIALADYWARPATLIPGLKSLQVKGHVMIGIVVLFAFLGGVTVVTNLGYQRTHRPDQVATAIHASFQSPTLIAMPHKTHGQTGRLMGVAWELRRLSLTHAQQSSFLLAHQPQQDVTPAIAALQTAVSHLSRPAHVWRINFRSEANSRSDAVLKQQGCRSETKLLSVDGYRYQSYECRS